MSQVFKSIIVDFMGVPPTVGKMVQQINYSSLGQQACRRGGRGGLPKGQKVTQQVGAQSLPSFGYVFIQQIYTKYIYFHSRARFLGVGIWGLKTSTMDSVREGRGEGGGGIEEHAQ